MYTVIKEILITIPKEIWIFFTENHEVIGLIISLVGLFGLHKIIQSFVYTLFRKKWTYFWITLFIILLITTLIAICLTDTPITRIDIFLITYLVVCLIVVCVCITIAMADNRVQIQVKQKYDLFHTGGIDVPDIEVIPQKKNRTEP